MYNQIFFTNVLRLLDELGITKNQLAERAGISVSYLSDLTNGKANPSLKLMEQIADALQQALPSLLEHTDLDRQTLEAISGGKVTSSLPKGFERVTAILTEFQAYRVKQWDDENKAALRSKSDRPGHKL